MLPYKINLIKATTYIHVKILLRQVTMMQMKEMKRQTFTVALTPVQSAAEAQPPLRNQAL